MFDESKTDKEWEEYDRKRDESNRRFWIICGVVACIVIAYRVLF